MQGRSVQCVCVCVFGMCTCACREVTVHSDCTVNAILGKISVYFLQMSVQLHRQWSCGCYIILHNIMTTSGKVLRQWSSLTRQSTTRLHCLSSTW